VSPSIPLKLLPSKKFLGILPFPTRQNATVMVLHPLQILLALAFSEIMKLTSFVVLLRILELD